MKSTLRILFVLLSLVLNAMPLRADDARLAELKAKIKEVEKKAEQEQVVIDAKAALQKALQALNQARQAVSEKLGIADQLKSAQDDLKKADSSAKADLKQKLQTLEQQLEQDSEVQAATTAHREAKAKSRTILRETMERLDAGVSSMFSELGNLQNAKRSSSNSAP